ncbi:MAG: TrmH family RNA methyltransferase [Candidatus Coproplasma sp.]
MAITSRANPLVKKIASLSDKKFRREYGEYVVEGTKPVKECIKAGFEITALVCTPDTAEEFVNAIPVSEDVFKHISSEKTPQGALATVKIPDTSVVPPKGNCLLLDRLQDPGNLGTIIRTANAAGYEDIYLLNCTDAFSPKSVRASMSGIFFVRLHTGSKEEIFAALENTPLICADMCGEDVFSFRSPEKFCLCIGNEGRGVSEEITSRCAYTIGIPMRKTCESLNAAISAAIAMYTLKYRK